MVNSLNISPLAAHRDARRQRRGQRAPLRPSQPLTRLAPHCPEIAPRLHLYLATSRAASDRAPQCTDRAAPVRAAAPRTWMATRRDHQPASSPAIPSHRATRRGGSMATWLHYGHTAGAQAAVARRRRPEGREAGGQGRPCASARAPQAVWAAGEDGSSMLAHGLAEDVRLHLGRDEQRRRGRDVLEILRDLRGVDCVPHLWSREA